MTATLNPGNRAVMRTDPDRGERILAVLAERLQHESPETKAICRSGGSSLALMVEAADHIALKQAVHAVYGAAGRLKIYGALVRPLEGDAKAHRLVLAIIESGHALGMTVTAEGVETEAQARILVDLGCDLGQGFLWSAVRPEAELAEWLETRGRAGDTG